MAGALNGQAWANALYGLGGALQAFGAPRDQRSQILAANAANFQNLIQDQRAQRDRDFLLNYRMSQDAREYARQQKQDQAAADAEARRKELIGILPQNIQPYAELDPSIASDYLKNQWKGPEAPKTVGGMQYDPAQNKFVPIPGYTEQAQAIAAAGRAPQQPKQPSIITLYDKGGTPKSFFDTDPQIPGLLQGGWTEAAPKGEGITITNADGSVTQIGGTRKPQSSADQQSQLRATMIDDAIKEFDSINFDNVRAPMIVANESTNKSPVFNSLVQANLNSDEKKLLGNQAKIQEATISAITGAAYSEEQKRNMQAAYVPLATDSMEDRVRKLKDAAKFLKQVNQGVGRQDQYSNQPETIIEYVRDANGRLVPKAP